MRFTIYAAECCGNAANTFYPTKYLVTNAEELKAAARFDHACPFFEQFTRANANFISADCAAFDLDNDHTDDPAGWIEPQDLEKYFPGVAFAAVPSRNNRRTKGGKSARPRFHVYFPIRELASAEAYKALKESVLKIFPYFDANAIDVARFFFGNAAEGFVWHEGERRIDEFDSEFGIRNSELGQSADVSAARVGANSLASGASGGSENNSASRGSAKNASENFNSNSQSEFQSIFNSELNSETIPEGRRNSTLHEKALRLLVRYGDSEEAYNLFLEESKRCVPPLSTGELAKIWQSAYKFFKAKIEPSAGYRPRPVYEAEMAAKAAAQNANANAALASPAKNASVNFNSKSQSDSRSDFKSNSQSKFQSRFNSEFRILPIRAQANSELNSLSLIPNDYSDAGQAEVLVASYGGMLRYTEALGWLLYDGQVWQEARTLAEGKVLELTERQLADAEEKISAALGELVRSGVSEEEVKQGGKNFRNKMLLDPIQKLNYDAYLRAKEYHRFVIQRRDAKFLKSTLVAAKSMRFLATDKLDADPFLLNTPAGTYDLREGMSGKRPHRAEDFCTKITLCSPGDEGREMWEAALNLFFNNDAALIEFFQMNIGLSAIGKILCEQVMLAFGDGRNGKSTCFNALNGVLGTYGGNMSAEALVMSYYHNRKPELAEAKGKRVLVAPELPTNSQLDPAMVKYLCSTDPITAEKKFCQPFNYTPTASLIVFMNQLPHISALDEGTWRRLLPIPFTAVIESEGDIKNYAEELKRKAGPYILKWIIEGAKKAIDADYKIEKPKAVLEALGKYRSDNDWLAHFLDDACVSGEELQAKAGELYGAYRDFCDRSGASKRSNVAFSNALSARGFEKFKNRHGWFFKGLGLLATRK